MREIQIQSPDGKSRIVALEGQRLTLGRAANVELSYPNDTGLSRQHCTVEPEGDGWIVTDLRSKNGTMLKEEAVPPDLR